MERAPGSRRFGISLLAFSPHRLAGAATYTVGLTQALVSRAPERYTVFVPRRYEPLWRELLPWPLDFVVCGPNPDRRILRVLFEQKSPPCKIPDDLLDRRHIPIMGPVALLNRQPRIAFRESVSCGLCKRDLLAPCITSFIRRRASDDTS